MERHGGGPVTGAHIAHVAGLPSTLHLSGRDPYHRGGGESKPEPHGHQLPHNSLLHVPHDSHLLGFNSIPQHTRSRKGALPVSSLSPVSIRPKGHRPRRPLGRWLGIAGLPSSMERGGGGVVDRSARMQLVLDNDLLAFSFAWKFRWSGEDIEDLRQVAREALVVAAHRFDPSQGARFVTYASRFIWGRLMHHIRDKMRPIRHPRPADLGGRSYLRMVSLEALLEREEHAAEFEARLGAVDPGFDAVETRLAVEQILAASTKEKKAALATKLRRRAGFANRDTSKLGGAVPISRRRGRPIHRPAEKVA
jgi:RNA polymerase sigma factor (sigma-70 family)